MKKLFSLSAFLMLAMCTGFVSSCNDDVEETPPATVTPPDGNATENKDTHEYVDLGLPSGTLWATCNVGASKPEEYGDYFAWGEIAPNSYYSFGTYKYSLRNYQSMTKYCTNSNYGIVDNKSELEPSDDAATANWGGHWQMPSLEQCKEIFNGIYTTSTSTTLNGIKGVKLISKKNGNSIFLPAAGYRADTSLHDAGSRGYFWSRSLSPDSNNEACYIIPQKGYADALQGGPRSHGQSVRPVRVNK